MGLLITLFFCHFLADYTHLSASWMLDAKRFGKPLIPILAHALIHGTLMYIILMINLWFKPHTIENLLTVFSLTAFQIVTHFLIDVLKGRMNGWFPSLQSPANKWHWVVFGADQFLHAVVIILMASFAI